MRAFVDGNGASIKGSGEWRDPSFLRHTALAKGPKVVFDRERYWACTFIQSRPKRACPRLRDSSTLHSAYMGLGYMFFSDIWTIFGWVQIGSYIIKFNRFMGFPGFSAYMVYFRRTTPWPIYPERSVLIRGT